MLAVYLFLAGLTVACADHSGAYSSPQYAKKFYPKQAFDTNLLLPQERPPVPFNRHESIDRVDSANDTSEYARASFLDSAGDMLSNTGGQIMGSLFKDFIARSTGSSQVLSLNLTNLVILIVLKALVLAAGFFGAGAWKGHYYGRSIDDNMNASYITEDEILLYLGYLTGQQTKNFNCLYKLSCQRPQQAGLYSSGAELLIQGAKLMNGNSIDLNQYEEVARGIKEAASWGEDRMPCAKRYQCGNQ